MKTVYCKLGVCLCFALFFVFVNPAAAFKIFVSVPPHAYVAEQLLGDQSTVHSVISGGQDPHTFTPSPKQIVALSRADIFFTAGLVFERQLLPKIRGINQGLLIVDLGEETDSIAEHHNEEGLDSAHELDPHQWLSPDHLIEQARRMTSGLSKYDPGRKTSYQEKLQAFTKRVLNRKEEISKELHPFVGRSFFVFHPAFGYFGRAFGLRQQAVETGGKLPSPRQLAGFVKKARAENVRVILCQPQFDQKSAQIVARAIDGKIVLADPMVKNVIENYQQIATTLKLSFSN